MGEEKKTEKSIEDLFTFRMLPISLQKVVSEAYRKVKNLCNKSFEEISIGYQSKDLTEKLLLPNEKFIKKPLKLNDYELKTHEKIIHKNSNTEVFLTDKRLMLVNTELDSYPELRTQPDITVSYSSKDFFKMLSIPLKHISSIWLDFYSNAKATTLISKINYLWLIALGALLMCISFIFWLMEHFEVKWLVFMPVGIGMIIAAFILKSHKIHKPETTSERADFISMSVIEPLYNTRANLFLNVDTEVHNLDDIIEWVKSIQEKCKDIV